MSALSVTDVALIEQGVKVAALTPWAKIANEFRRKDYLDVGDAVVEDALAIAAPMLPGAAAAKMVIHLAVSTVDQHKSDGPGAPVTAAMVMKGLTAAEGVDWKAYYQALKDGNGLVAGADTAEIMASIAAPFFPPLAAATPIFAALAFVGGFTQPNIKSHYDGYHWDMLQGFVRDKPGDKPEPADANNPLKWLADMFK